MIISSLLKHKVLKEDVAEASSFVSESMKDNTALHSLLLICLPQSAGQKTLNFDRDIESRNKLL